MTRLAVVVRLAILRGLLARPYTFATNGRDHGGFQMTGRSFTRTCAVSAAAVFAAVLALAFAAPPAGAASDCGAAVIKDWRNARLHANYAPACYRQALRELPEDIRIYSTAEDDINRALIASLAKKATTAYTSKVGAVKGVVRTLASTKSSNAVRKEAARAAADPSASAVPITVLVFGAGALVLVATAVASVVVRRLRRG
jgi:hypothetical protein